MTASFVRYALACVLATHGFAHVVGFAASWRLISSTEVPYKTTLLAGRVDVGDAGIRVVGVLWLLTALAFMTAAVLLARRSPGAPLLIAGVVLVSTILCALGWPEARIGLLVNLGLIVALPAIGSFAWREASREVERNLNAPRQADTPAFSVARIDAVPTPVARYFARVLKPGQRRIRSADVVQDAEFFVGGRWRPLRASQRFTVAPAGFLWDTRIGMAPGMPVYVRDAYVNGRGSMCAEFLGVYPVASQAGPRELDAGSLQRYLAEAIWFPTALLPASGVRWEAIDDRSARATLTDAHSAVSLEFRFNRDGDVVEIFTPSRYAEVAGSYELRPWLVRCGEYGEFGGMRIPVRCEVEWHLPAGPAPYWRGRIVDARYEFAD